MHNCRAIMNQARTPYEILGNQGVKQLAEAFYDAMDALPEAAGIRAMHAEDLTPVKRMFAAYLTGWLGGPPVYHAIKGTVCLTEVHAAWRIGPAERDAWLACMDEALARIGADSELKAMLKEPLMRIADTVRNCEDSSQDPNIIAMG